jgi:hypothetical protein
MPQASSRRERECVADFVEDGHSRREAGSIESRPRGGFRHGKQPAITMPELAAALPAEKAISVTPATLWHFLIACGFSFKKTLRASEQDRPDLIQARAADISRRNLNQHQGDQSLRALCNLRAPRPWPLHHHPTRAIIRLRLYE